MGPSTSEPSSLRWISRALWLLALGVIVLLAVFPDAVTRLRQRLAPYATADQDCDLSSSACEARFPDGVSVRLAVDPQPVRGLDPVRFEVWAQGDTPRSVELYGLDMNMGYVRVPLTLEGARYVGEAVLPACTLDKMSWRANVILEGRVAGFTVWSTR